MRSFNVASFMIATVLTGSAWAAGGPAKSGQETQQLTTPARLQAIYQALDTNPALRKLQAQACPPKGCHPQPGGKLPSMHYAFRQGVFKMKQKLQKGAQ